MKTSPCTEPRVAFYAGSFDPFTRGHQNIVDRALTLFDRVVVGIGVNPAKTPFMAADARKAWIEAVYAGEPRVEVVVYEGLTVDAARAAGAAALLRGVRSAVDYDAELSLAQVNRDLGGIETVLLPTAPELSVVSSTLVRSLLRARRDATPYLPVGAPLHLLPS